MGYSYATLFVLVCVAIMATTTPSTAQSVTLNLNANLNCDPLAPAAANATVNLLCPNQTGGGLGVAISANTTTNGVISASARINVGTNINNVLRLLTGSCMFVAASEEICPDSNPTSTSLVGTRAIANITRLVPTEITVNPAGILRAITEIRSFF